MQRSFQGLESQYPAMHIRGEEGPLAEQIGGGVEAYIRHRVSRLAIRCSLLQEEEMFLLEQLTAAPNRIYLWAKHGLDCLEQSVLITTDTIRSVTTTLPDTVDQEYGALLQWSGNYGPVKAILHMVIAARRPLSIKTLATALKVFGDGSIEIKPMHQFQNTLPEMCGLIITVVDGTIQLIHPTVMYFLIKPNDDDDEDIFVRAWEKTLRPRDSHLILSEACVKHLHHAWSEPTPNGRALSQWPRTTPFYIHELALDILRRDDDIGYFWYINSMADEYSLRLTPLMKASFLGLTRAVEGLLGEKNAANGGHEAAVSVLLKTAKVNLDSADKDSVTPLACAAAKGHNAVVRLLLGAGKLDFDSRDAFDDTALMRATANKHYVIVRLLVAAGAKTPGSLSTEGIAGKILPAYTTGEKRTLPLDSKERTRNSDEGDIMM
ncbi:hypothetical protein BJX64DRAFT_288995 [Aspergillus heterothallicus]